MTYFEQALSAPELHFKRLRQIEPLLVNNKIVVRRTHHAIETKIVWDERQYILSLPFHRESLRHIEELNEIAYERSNGPLLHHRIIYDELTMIDSLGRKHSFDIVLQELPEGMPFDEALQTFKADDLLQAIVKMKERMNNIGFLHRNLRPYNIHICKSGIARPLRYWYAKWESFSDNDISQLLEAINAARSLPEECKKPLILNDEEIEHKIPRFHEGIKCLCRCGRYGFIDYEGDQVTPYIYSWAGNFHEGRAIVSNNKKFGAIDNQGKKVIPVTYQTLEYDHTRCLFTGTISPYRYLIDYDGKIIRRWREDEEEEQSK